MELIHGHGDKLLLLEVLDVDHFAGLIGDDERTGQGVKHLQFFKDRHRSPEPVKGDPDIPVDERKLGSPLLSNGDGCLHLSTRFDPDIHPDLSLDIGKHPLDEQLVKIPGMKELLDVRVLLLLFQPQVSSLIQFNRHNIRIPLPDCFTHFFDALLRDVCSPDDSYLTH